MSWCRAHLDDGIVLAGLSLIAYGLALYSPPLGPIALGLGLIVAVRLGSS